MVRSNQQGSKQAEQQMIGFEFGKSLDQSSIKPAVKERDTFTQAEVGTGTGNQEVPRHHLFEPTEDIWDGFCSHHCQQSTMEGE